jgi:hypothetical protein
MLSRKACSPANYGTSLMISYFEPNELSNPQVNVNGKAPKGSKVEMQPLSPKRMNIIEKAFFDNCGLINVEAKIAWRKAIDAMNKKLATMKKKLL